MMVLINSGSWFARLSMSSEISFRSSFCCSVSSCRTNLAGTLCRFKSLVRMEWTEPVLIPTSATIFCTVKRRSSSTFLQTWSITSSFRLMDGLPEQGSLSADAWPSLKHLNHCFIWVGLKTSFPKACWIFRIVSTWVSPSFWQNLMQYLCSVRSVIEMKFPEKSTNTCHLPALNALQRKKWMMNRLETLHDYTWMCVCAATLCMGNSLIPCWRERKRLDTFQTDLVYFCLVLQSFTE